MSRGGLDVPPFAPSPFSHPYFACHRCWKFVEGVIRDEGKERRSYLVLVTSRLDP